jgi:transposase
VRAAIKAVGAEVRYLSPFSPDLNPIEQLFAKLKALLRKVVARSIEALWTAITHLTACFAPEQCGDYFRSSGYLRSV